MGIKEQAVARRKLSLDAAIDLCGRYFEFDPIVTIELETSAGTETFDVTFNSCWSMETIERMDALNDFIDDECDHEDVLERNAETNEPLVHPNTGEALTKRVPKLPYQIDGVEIEPNYNLRYLTALWGDEDKARRAQAAGLTHGVVSMLFSRMADQFTQWKRSREQHDPK